MTYRNVIYLKRSLVKIKSGVLLSFFYHIIPCIATLTSYIGKKLYNDLKDGALVLSKFCIGNYVIHFKSRQNLVLLKNTTLLTLHILRSTCKAIASIFHMQSRCTCIDVFEESNSCQRCDSGYRVFRKLVFKLCGWMQEYYILTL